MKCQMMIFESGMKTGSRTLSNKGKENLEDFGKLLDENQETIETETTGNAGQATKLKENSCQIEKIKTEKADEETCDIMGSILSLDIKEALDSAKNEDVIVIGQNIQSVIDGHTERNIFRRDSTENIIVTRMIRETGPDREALTEKESGLQRLDAAKIQEMEIKSDSNVFRKTDEFFTEIEDLKPVVMEYEGDSEKLTLKTKSDKGMIHDFDKGIEKSKGEVAFKSVNSGNISGSGFKITKTKELLNGMESLTSDNMDEIDGIHNVVAETDDKSHEIKNLKLEKDSDSVIEKPFNQVSNAMKVMDAVTGMDKATDEKQEISKMSLINQMSESIETGMEGNNSFIKINLKPHFYGEMSIDLVKSSEGITAKISAEKDVVKHLLKDSSREIAALFEEKNLKVGNIIIEVREPSEQQVYSDRNREGFNGNFGGGFNEGSSNGYKHERNGNGSRGRQTVFLGKNEEFSQRKNKEMAVTGNYGEGINIVV